MLAEDVESAETGSATASGDFEQESVARFTHRVGAQKHLTRRSYQGCGSLDAGHTERGSSGFDDVSKVCRKCWARHCVRIGQRGTPWPFDLRL